MANAFRALPPRVPGGVLAAALLALAALLLPLDISWQLGLVMAATWAVAAVALDVWQGTLGELSFGHVAFAAVGGYVYALGGSSWGLPAPAAAVLALVATAISAWITAQAVCRLSHAGSAITTLFLAFLVVELIGAESLRSVTHGENGLMVPFMQFGGLDLLQIPVQLGLAVACLVITVVLCHNYRRGRAGRALAMIKRSQLAAASLGIEVQSAKIKAFTFSAFFAGLAGILLVTSVGFVTPGMFTPTASILLVAMVVVGGTRTTVGPVLGAVFFSLLPISFQGVEGGQGLYIALIFLGFLVFLPTGVVGLLRLALPTGPSVPQVCAQYLPGLDSPSSDVPTSSPERRLGLSVENLEVSFGEIKALQGVSVTIAPGEVHAIVGANGAGKTTLLNVLSGAQQPTSGGCTLGNRSIGGSTPAAVRRMGLSRTFQHPAVSLELTAVQNVSLGLYHSHRWSLLRDLAGHFGRKDVDAAVMDMSARALELVGMRPSRHHLPAAELSMAELKQVDIARSLADDDTGVVLLDEPTAGLSQLEMSQLKECLERVQRTRGLTMVIVGHHVEFLTALADRMTVLNAGQVVASGTPSEVLALHEVRAAFLGTPDQEERA